MGRVGAHKNCRDQFSEVSGDMKKSSSGVICRKSLTSHERPGSGGCFHDFSTPLGLKRQLSLSCSGGADGSLCSLDDLDRLEGDEHEQDEQRCNRSDECDSDFSSSLESLDLELQPDKSYSAYISGMRSVSKKEAKRMELREQMKSSAEQTSWSSNLAVCDTKVPVINKDRDSVKFPPDAKESRIYKFDLGLTRRKTKPPNIGHPSLETTTKGRMPALIRRRITLTMGFSRLGKGQKK